MKHEGCCTGTINLPNEINPLANRPKFQAKYGSHENGFLNSKFQAVGSTHILLY